MLPKNTKLFHCTHQINKIVLGLFICFSLLYSLPLEAQSLTLYVIPPKRPIDWRSPKHLIKSYIKSYIAKTSYKKYPHPIGHVIVELEGTSYYALCDMVVKSSKHQTYLVRKKAYGLGVLSAVLPGKLRENQINTDDLNQRFPNGDVAFLRYDLSEDMFNRLRTYLEEYKMFGFDSLYNGENKPREGKGAGCSAFGVSFLEVAGLLTQEQKNAWQVVVPVQQELLGGPLHHHRRVSIPRIAFTKRWAKKFDSTAHTIQYYEPYLMYRWIQNEFNNIVHTPTSNTVPINKLQAKGCLFNCKQQAIPRESIWQFKDNRSPIYSTTEF